ncbi:MAG: hypothetical protein ACF8PN_04250 [Phycisphaerales bacterium]
MTCQTNGGRFPWLLLLLSLGLLLVGLSRVAHGQDEIELDDSTIDEPMTPEVEAPVEPEFDNTPQLVEVVRLENGLTLLLQDTPNTSHSAIVVMLASGEHHDPSDAPGLARMLARLALTSAAPGAEPATPESLDDRYDDGWSARAYPEHIVFGWVVPHEEAPERLQELGARLSALEITEGDLSEEVERLSREQSVEFESGRPEAPINWLVAKTFRHASGDARGLDPERLRRLGLERVQREWRRRAAPSDVTVLLCGRVDGLTETAATTLGAIEGDDTGASTPMRVHVQPAGPVAREVIVPRLPLRKPHAAVAFYAPEIDAPDHPAFLAVSYEFTRQARRLPGVEARLPFQYSLLLDPRAAYLTPHPWRFPKGPDQALGYWVKKIENKRFNRTDVKRAYRALAWQLGDDLPGSIIARLDEQPEVLFTIGYASAFRHARGGPDFWDAYRRRFKGLDGVALEAVRDRHFFSDGTWALFVLREQP